MTSPINVFIVDDHAVYRDVAAAVVEATAGFEVVGSASNAEAAVESILAVEPSPDLVLMDVNLGDGNGLDVTTAVTARRPDLRVVFVSALAIEDLPDNARTSGAVGYLPKQQLSPATLEELQAGAYDWRR
ncbi:MAG: response regulator [Acidimicrobiales bacterium]